MKQVIQLLIILFISGVCTFAQTKPEHKPKVYRSPEGRLFINKSLGVYLRLATSPDEDAESYLLKSEITTEYSNPMYFDTEGYNTFRSPSAVDTVTKKPVYPQKDVIFEVYSDSEPPDSKISYGDAGRTFIRSKLYLGSGASIVLESRDVTSGTDKTYVSVNSSDYKEYTQPIPVNEQKEYTIKYYSVDNVGNAEEDNEITFVVDTESPVTSHTIEGDQEENVLSGRSKITLSATDNSSGIRRTYYQIDGGKPRIYSGTIYMKYLSQGEHTLTYYSVDKVKNREEKKDYVFFLDKTPPIVVEEVLGDQFYINGKAYSSGRTKLKITAVDNKAGVKEIYYSIDRGEKQLYEKPFYLPSQSGSVVIRSYAVDKVNNMSGTTVENSRTHATYIDLTGPSLDYNFSGHTFKYRDTIYISGETKIVLKAYDSESGLNKITYSLDKLSEMTYNEPFTINSEGRHEISYFGYDNVNNSNVSRFTFYADLSGPEIVVLYSIVPHSQTVIEDDEVPVFPSHTEIYIGATDQKVGNDKIYYSINGNSEKLYRGIISGFQNNKEYNIRIRAVDKLDNASEKEVQFKVED